MSEKQIFTLKQVVLSIKKSLEERYKQAYWIKAELHKLNRYPSGHCFPELVQKENGKTVAQLNGTIWKAAYEKIDRQFKEVVKEPLKEGSEVLILARIVFSETFGLSLQILDIDPNYSLGELQREREETILKLNKEGLLNANQKLDFPLLPKRIAIISADTSKGLMDFLQVLEENPYGYVFSTHLFQAYLQGDVAILSIQQQLKKIEQVKEYFDVVVIVRGGGGEVGMTCYNNYELCKSIATFPLPVLTGIGHSTNMTVAEMIAYRNGITPTKLAEMLIRCFDEFAHPLAEAQKLLVRISRQLIENSNRELNNLVSGVKLLVNQHVGQQKTELTHTKRLLSNGTRMLIQRKGEELSQEKIAVGKTVQSRSNREREYLLESQRKLTKRTDQVLTTQNENLRLGQDKLPLLLRKMVFEKEKEMTQLERVVDMLNPRLVLRRGYSITRKNGEVISPTNPLKPGDKITTFTYDYEVESETTAIRKTENER